MTERQAFVLALMKALAEGLSAADRERVARLLQETPCDES